MFINKLEVLKTFAKFRQTFIISIKFVEYFIKHQFDFMNIKSEKLLLKYQLKELIFYVYSVL